MALPLGEIQRIQVVQHPALTNFNAEFGTGHDLSRYESIHSELRATSAEVTYLNHLQMDAFIPSSTALLLKNNFHDAAFVTHTTRSILYDLRQSGKIGDTCFNFLHEKVNAQDFQSVFRYLYILMLYRIVATAHDAQNPDPAFAFVTSANYSNRLIRSTDPVLVREEKALQDQARKQFMTKYLTEVASRPGCPADAQRQALSTIAAIGNSAQFRTSFLILLEKLENTPELEKICWKEFHATMTPFTDQNFFEQAYLRLKTENYYKNCLSRVSTLRQSLDRTDGHDLLHLSEQCKKAYNGCIYLLGDNKNMAACSPMRFAALTGKMRTEWQSINNIFSRAQQQYAHRLCSCQVQTPPTQNELAEWPFNSHPLFLLQPAQPVTPQQLQLQGINPATYQENQKKTVAVIGCKWGGGHMEIARGICNNLASLGYHSVSVDLPEVLMFEDPVRNFFLTRWLGKDWCKGSLYVGLIKEKAYATINFLRWISAKFFSSEPYTQKSLKLVLEELLKINPSAVALDYTADNEVVTKACEILGIPILHVGADINNVIETRSQAPTYPHFKMALPFNVPEVVNSVIQTTTESQRVFTGPPVKHEFTMQRTATDIQRLKQEWGIEINKKVVIVANGLAGGFSTYPEILAKKYAHTNPEDVPIHLVVLCGKDNNQFKRHLEQNVQHKTNLPMSIELSTNKMEELLSMASYGGALIGKAGTTTIFESITRGTRLLIDNARPRFFSQGLKHFFLTCWDMLLRMFGFPGQIFWEKDNADFTRQHGLSDMLEKEEDFLPKLESLLNNDDRPVSHGIEIKNIETELPKHLRGMIVRAEVDLVAGRAREIHRNL